MNKCLVEIFFHVYSGPRCDFGVNAIHFSVNTIDMRCVFCVAGATLHAEKQRKKYGNRLTPMKPACLWKRK